MRILVVEDTEKLANYIKKGLKAKGYSVDCVYDGERAERRIRAVTYDLVILDLMLPGKDGIAICSDLRKDNFNIPILMLTAKGEIEDRVNGLDCGADDYLVKPFDFEELCARIRALLRRPKDKNSEIIEFRDIVIDDSKFLVKKAGKPLDLTVKEYTVLNYLALNKDNVVTREQILNHCWDWSYDSFSNIVDVYIKKLRIKLNDKEESYIQTLRGAGYRLNG